MLRHNSELDWLDADHVNNCYGLYSLVN